MITRHHTFIHQHLEPSREKTPPPGQALASLQQVYKHFDRVEALKGVSLDIVAGELLALLGPNGSGKTTTLSLLLGLRKPDQGLARLFGLDPRLPQARKQVGVTPQETAFPPTLKVGEIITLVQLHYPVAPPTKDLLERFGLTGLEKRQVGGLSGGQKRRLAVALAFAGNPTVVFLDEPTAGLDVEARRQLWQEIAAYQRNGGTVLLTTHYLEEAEALASRVVILHKGQKVSEGTVEEMKAQVGLKRVRFAASSLPALPAVERVEQEQDRYSLYTADPEALVRSLLQQNVDIHGLEVTSTTLEEAFLHLTGGEV